MRNPACPKGIPWVDPRKTMDGGVCRPDAPLGIAVTRSPIPVSALGPRPIRTQILRIDRRTRRRDRCSNRSQQVCGGGINVRRREKWVVLARTAPRASSRSRRSTRCVPGDPSSTNSIGTGFEFGVPFSPSAARARAVAGGTRCGLSRWFPRDNSFRKRSWILRCTRPGREPPGTNLPTETGAHASRPSARRWIGTAIPRLPEGSHGSPGCGRGTRRWEGNRSPLYPQSQG